MARATLSYLLLGAAITAAACIPVNMRNPSIHHVEEVDSILPPVLLHMHDGSVYEASSWNEFQRGDTALYIWGAHYGPDRALLDRGEYKIPLESIALIQKNRNDTKYPLGLSLLATTSVFWGALTIACVADPKSCFGSCPTFYIDDIDSARPLAEGFSASIARSLEATDLDALGVSRPGGEAVVIRMQNEALETHAVRSVNLVAVRRVGGRRTVASADGGFFQVREERLASRCNALHGDCSGLTDAEEAVPYETVTDSLDLGVRDTLVLALAGTASINGLVLRARQKFVSTFLIYQAMDYMGPRAVEWLARLERGDPLAVAAYHNLVEITGTITISVSYDGVTWNRVGYFDEAGPIAADEMAFRIPDSVRSDSVYVMLDMARGSWRVEAATLARLLPANDVRALAPSIVDASIDTYDAASALIDPDEYLVTRPGDRTTLSFDLPDTDETYDLYLRSRGYYYEWMRSEWLADEDPDMVATLFANPSRALREMASDFKRLEPEIEREFWNSRYGR